MTFEELKLAEPLLRAVKDEGYTTPTPIQQQAIPPALEGRDVLGCAQTGTGKTAAFALPMLHLIGEARPAARKTGGLVLVPTRELAMQVAEALHKYAKGSGVTVSTICPGYIATPMTAKNPYPMPFMLSADEAAGKIAKIIERGRSFAVIPWQMAVVARCLRVLPNGLYDALFARAQRKPRRGE